MSGDSMVIVLRMTDRDVIERAGRLMGVQAVYIEKSTQTRKTVWGVVWNRAAKRRLA